MNPIEYLVSKSFRVTSDPNQYYESYNPNRGKKPWGKRDYTEYGINYDSYCGGYHRAYDLARYDGAPIPSIANGGVVVSGTSEHSNFGTQVVIAYDDLKIQVIYGHLKRGLKVKIGDKVNQGDIVGYQGNTNYDNVYMDSHLHIQFQNLGYIADERTFVCSGIDPLNIDVTPKKVDPFVESIKDQAIADYKSSKILPSVTIAQAILESARGKSELAKKANNLFGIKGEYNGKSYTVKTKEFTNGKWVTIDAAFKKYPSTKESIADHGKFFTSTEWRKNNYKAVLNAKTYTQQAEALQSCGYATDPGYADKLIGIIEKENLSQFDPGKATASKEVTSPKVSNGKVYTVKKGDTLWSISRKYNTTVAKIKSLNGLKSDKLSIGQKLKVSETKDAAYTVKKGDTLYSIARTHGTTVSNIKTINGLKSDTITIGQVLKVSGTNLPAEKDTKKANPAKRLVFNPKTNRGRSLNAYVSGTIDNLGASVRKRSGSRSTGFNWNTKAGYDLKPGDLVYIFEVHQGWGRIYTGDTSGRGSNEWIHLDRMKVKDIYK